MIRRFNENNIYNIFPRNLSFFELEISKINDSKTLTIDYWDDELDEQESKIRYIKGNVILARMNKYEKIPKFLKDVTIDGDFSINYDFDPKYIEFLPKEVTGELKVQNFMDYHNILGHIIARKMSKKLILNVSNGKIQHIEHDGELTIYESGQLINIKEIRGDLKYLSIWDAEFFKISENTLPKSLEYLSLSNNNNIVEWDYDLPNLAELSFSNIRNLKSLKLNSNIKHLFIDRSKKLSSINKLPNTLHRLKLNNTSINNLDFLSGPLKGISIERSPIGDLLRDNKIYLKELNILLKSGVDLSLYEVGDLRTLLDSLK